MNSCLYECQVMHARLSPRRHAFRYRIFLFALDLDELDPLSRRLRLFSRGRRNLYSFRDQDYLPTDAMPDQPAESGRSLKQRVVAFLAERGVKLDGGRVMLLTLPRILGYGFNPVSFYFCFDRAGSPITAIAEVTNTFREVKPYFLGPDTRGANSSEAHAFYRRVPKFFYVSPFSDVDVAFDFTLRVPGENLSLQIDDYAGEVRTLTSTLTGRRRELTNTRLAWFVLKYPLLTARVVALIHWHALRLWLKRVPWFAKAARASEQRDLYRPHASLAPRPTPPSGSLRPQATAEIFRSTESA